MTAPSFIHLRLHTEFSVTDGITRIDDAVELALASRMPALGISDLMNLFGMVKFYKACQSHGVKPIIGADVWLENEQDRDQPARVLLIAQNEAGYHKLCELLTNAYRGNQYRGRAEIKRAWLAASNNQHLIMLSGAIYGDVGQALAAGNLELAREHAVFWAQCFPQRYYLEIQRSGHDQSDTIVEPTLWLAGELGLPVVATHPIQFAAREDFKAHEARVCIAEGHMLGEARRPRRYSETQYFKSASEMAALFADVPEALAKAIPHPCRPLAPLRQNSRMPMLKKLTIGS